MLQVKNLSKSYKTNQGVFHALKDVSVTVNRGEIFGFMGLSGAGKTSLARCVSALEAVDSGEIFLGEVDITKLKGRKLREARKRMGLVFQHFNLLMNSTVFDNIAFPLRLEKKYDKTYIHNRVTELLETVGLTEKKLNYPATLSGGQKQRVGIARALATKPELIICDEATSALDPDTTRSILALLKKIGRETGVTFLVITHEMDVIKDLCTHVAVMEDGEIIECGTVLEVLTKPKTDTAKRFFSHEYIDAEWLKATTPPGRSSKICRAVFKDTAVRHSFVTHIVRRYDVELSILSGNIENVGGVMVGSLILELIGSDESLEKAMATFEKAGVELEVIENV